MYTVYKSCCECLSSTSLLACISPLVYITVSFNSPSYAEDLLRKTYISKACFVRYEKAAKLAFESAIVVGNPHIECLYYFH